MNFVFIGAGNVANQLALDFYRKGHTILQIFSRTEKSAKLLADKVNSSFTTDINKIDKNADGYFYCVNDDILPSLISFSKLPDSLHIHTSGSTSMDVFNGFYKNAGVLYPLQTFSKKREVNIAEVPFFIEANNEATKDKIFEIGNILSNKIYFADSDSRKKIHLSAVFVCNFVNHMYEVGGELVQNAGFTFDILRPLIEETFEKIKTLSPYEAQTGPALRDDITIMRKHLDLLENKRDLSHMYKLISDDILEIHKK